ncbi:unnamed protein product, partial [Closterium sp. Naga37s-1]
HQKDKPFYPAFSSVGTSGGSSSSCSGGRGGCSINDHCSGCGCSNQMNWGGSSASNSRAAYLFMGEVEDLCGVAWQWTARAQHAPLLCLTVPSCPELCLDVGGWGGHEEDFAATGQALVHSAAE